MTLYNVIFFISDQIYSTSVRTRHVPCGAAYYVVSTDPKFHEQPHVFRGRDCLDRFLDSITATSKRLKEIVTKGAMPLRMTEEQQREFESATCCHICKKDFLPDDPAPHRDHDHITGVYRGAAHAGCNINHRYSSITAPCILHTRSNVFIVSCLADEVRYTIPCFFHNLANFDSHLLMCAVKKRHMLENRFSCIPKTTEKYISFNIGLVDYRDSLQFAMNSLDGLVSLLKPEVCILCYNIIESIIVIILVVYHVLPRVFNLFYFLFRISCTCYATCN